MHLVEGDTRAAMSKRRGEFVTLDELLDEIGVDATRYFMLQSSHDRTLDLNLDLARSQSSDNPVYYIQYAHARIASMLARLGEERVGLAVSAGADWSSPAGELHPSERELIKKLLSLPEEIAEAAERRAPHRIAGFALELAQEFTAFYRDCKVVGARAGVGRVVPDRAVRRVQDAAGAGARAARGERARVDVASDRSDEVGRARRSGAWRRRVERRSTGQRGRRRASGALAPLRQRVGQQRQAAEKERRRQDVDGQVEAAGGLAARAPAARIGPPSPT